MQDIDPSSADPLSTYDKAMINYKDWPIDENLERPAGQTSNVIREMVAIVNDVSRTYVEGTQQYITPDRMTAGSLIHFGREHGLSEEDLENVYHAVAELELFRDLNKGEHPLPLSAYPQEVVDQKLAELRADLRT